MERDVNSRLVAMSMGRLRKKLKDDPKDPRLLRQYTGSPLRPVAIHGRGAFVGLGLRHRAVARPPGAIAHKRTNHGGAGGRVAGLRSPALLPERDGRKPDAIHRLLSPPASELADVAALGQADPSGTAQTLLAVAELHRERPRFAELHRRGVVAVFRSLRQLVGTKGYAILKPATLVG